MLVQRGDGEITGAAVDADGDGPRQHGRVLHQAAQQEQRKIVDRFVPHVLQRLEGGAMPGAREAGDQQQALLRRARTASAGLRRRVAGRRNDGVGHGGGIMRAASRTASRTLAGAEASAGSIKTWKTSIPIRVSVIFSGIRSMPSAGARSTSRASRAGGPAPTSTMPRPRTSILPRRSAGAWVGKRA